MRLGGGSAAPGSGGTMMWFGGSIPAAIAAAKQRSSVFVVFVSGTARPRADAAPAAAFSAGAGGERERPPPPPLGQRRPLWAAGAVPEAGRDGPRLRGGARGERGSRPARPQPSSPVGWAQYGGPVSSAAPSVSPVSRCRSLAPGRILPRRLGGASASCCSPASPSRRAVIFCCVRPGPRCPARRCGACCGAVSPWPCPRRGFGQRNELSARFASPFAMPLRGPACGPYCCDFLGCLSTVSFFFFFPEVPIVFVL